MSNESVMLFCLEFTIGEKWISEKIVWKTQQKKVNHQQSKCLTLFHPWHSPRETNISNQCLRTHLFGTAQFTQESNTGFMLQDGPLHQDSVDGSMVCNFIKIDPLLYASFLMSVLAFGAHSAFFLPQSFFLLQKTGEFSSLETTQDGQQESLAQDAQLALVCYVVLLCANKTPSYGWRDTERTALNWQSSVLKRNNWWRLQRRDHKILLLIMKSKKMPKQIFLDILFCRNGSCQQQTYVCYCWCCFVQYQKTNMDYVSVT